MFSCWKKRKGGNKWRERKEEVCNGRKELKLNENCLFLVDACNSLYGMCCLGCVYLYACLNAFHFIFEYLTFCSWIFYLYFWSLNKKALTLVALVNSIFFFFNLRSTPVISFESFDIFWICKSKPPVFTAQTVFAYNIRFIYNFWRPKIPFDFSYFETSLASKIKTSESMTHISSYVNPITFYFMLHQFP